MALKVLHIWSGTVFPFWQILSGAVRVDGNVTQSVQNLKGAEYFLKPLCIESLCVALFFLAHTFYVVDY